MRIQPQMPAQAYKTYQISSPVRTHYRDATCQEVECAAYAHGWMTNIDVAMPLGRDQANYIRLRSGRAFISSEVGTLVSFTFAPGQRCFAAHKVSLDRPEFYVVRDGDWRGNPRRTEPRIHSGAAAWVDDFATHQQALADEVQKG